MLNPLECRGNYSATSNNKLVHCPLIGGLLHLVQRGGHCSAVLLGPYRVKSIGLHVVVCQVFRGVGPAAVVALS